MLTNCQNCQYCTRRHYHPGDIGCAIYPEYWALWHRLQHRLQPNFAGIAMATDLIESCREFSLRQDLQPQTLTLSATAQQWRKLLFAPLPPELRQQIVAELGLEEGEIIMQEVDSSNIAAIGHDGISTLRVNFNRGASYHYFEVPFSVFEEFLAAESKGAFLNYRIKERYRYEYMAA